VNLTAILFNGTGNIDLFVNGTLVASGSSPLTNISNFIVEGVLNVTAVINASQNFTGSLSTYFITVIPSFANTAPNITLNAPANNTQFNNTQTVTFNYTARDDFNTSFTCTLNIDGTPNTTSVVTNNTPKLVTLNNLTYASHTWSVNCTDNATIPLANTSETRTFSINDTLAPSVSNIFPTMANEDTATNFTANVSDNVNVTSCDLYVNGTKNGSMTVVNGLANRTLNLTQPGIYFLFANCTDAQGNVNSSSSTQVTIIDTTPPVVTIISPIATIYTNTSVLLSFNATDNGQLDTIYYMYNDSLGNLTQNFTFTTLFNKTFSDNSTVTLRVFANDTSGNIGSATVTFSINVSATPDNQSPAIINVTSSEITNITARINWTTDEAGNTTVLYGFNATTLNFTNFTTPFVTAHSIVLDGLSNNTLVFYNVTSCDTHGNCNNSGVYNFTTTQHFDTTPPVVTSQFIFPRAVINGSKVALNLTATDYQLNGTFVNITYPNGTTVTFPISKISLFNFTSLVDGNYTVVYFANDTAGNIGFGNATTFIVAEEFDLNKNVTNSTPIGIPVSESIYFDGTEDPINYTNFTGLSLQQLPNTFFNVLFVAYNGSLSVLFRHMNIASSNNHPLGLDMLVPPVTGYLNSYAVNSSFVFSTAQIHVNYSGYTNENNLHLDICSDWDFMAQSCRTTFAEASSSFQNLSGHYFLVNVSSFSGFSIRETVGGGGGGGGGSGGGGGGGGGGGPFPPVGPPTPPYVPPSLMFCDEDWTCGPWSGCTSGIETRDCIDQNGCGTDDLKPAVAETCEMPPVIKPEQHIVVEVPGLIELFRRSLTAIAGILLSGLVLAMLLGMFFERRAIVPVRHEAHVLARNKNDVLVARELLLMAEKALEEIFTGEPDEKLWRKLYRKYPPLVVRVCRLALVGIGADGTDTKKREPIVVAEHYDYMDYRTFVAAVRALAVSKLTGETLIKEDPKKPTRKLSQDDQVVEEYPEVIASENPHEPDRIPLRTMELAKMQDLKRALAELREGPGMLIIDISKFRSQGADALRLAIKQLKRVADITEGGIIGMGADWIVVTNEIRVETHHHHESKTTHKKSGKHAR
jgi:SepF-like predicted cell division protein (DUF552 family)/uncharacterized membrane protein YgcG